MSKIELRYTCFVVDNIALKHLHLQDVGAAVFMATATATPEMFTNVISTFIAESDMGLGTIIGSLMWNILGVAAVSSLANRNVSKVSV